MLSPIKLFSHSVFGSHIHLETTSPQAHSLSISLSYQCKTRFGSSEYTPDARCHRAMASSSRNGNPRLGSEPWFAYPTPSAEQIEEELPPYFEDENVPLGPMLDGLVRRGYGDMRVLVEKT